MGLGDRALQEEIEAAHLEAIEAALAFMEKEVISSRAGDPHLHDHVVIANRVFCPNGKVGADGKPLGKWRAIDSKALYKSVVAASERLQRHAHARAPHSPWNHVRDAH